MNNDIKKKKNKMNFNKTNEAFYRIEGEIQQAVQEKSAYEVDFYHCFRSCNEAKELKLHLQRMNDTRLATIINHMEERIEFYEQAISRYT